MHLRKGEEVSIVKATKSCSSELAFISITESVDGAVGF